VPLLLSSLAARRARIRNESGLSYRMIIAALLLVFASLLTASVEAATETAPSDRAAVLKEAVVAFDEGTALIRQRPQAAADAFERSVEKFESLIDDGVVNGRLYYNLGNAYLQLGRLGKAIVNYRRAEKLIGGDVQLEHNLQYARRLRRNDIQQSGERALLRTVFFWHYTTSIRARYLVAMTGFVLFWLFLIVQTVYPRTGWRVAALVCLLVWVPAGASVAIERVRADDVVEGVTTASDIVVRKGDGEGYDPQFKEELHEGVEFTVVQERSGWYRIALPNGLSGWIKKSQAEII